MRYRVVMFDDTNTPFPTEKTYFNCDSLEEAKSKKEQLEKEHSNMEGKLSCWFKFKIQVGEERTYIKTVWKELV